MKRAAFTVAGLILAATALSEDLPAGAQLLSRVKIHIKQELQRLAMISCLETVQREVKQPKGKMRPLDTIRLEVLTNGDKELFASPGDRKFSEKHPLSYAGGGTLGNGLFGLYLTDIVAGESVSEHYIGEEEIGGRRLVRYDYQVPPFLSGQNISTPEGSGRVGLHGSFWVDPQTYDVVRLEFKGDEFPPTLPLTEMTTRIDYARSLLRNDMSVLLPDAADFHLVKNSGEISHNLVEFTHCRVFEAESTIDFIAPDSTEQTPRFGTATIDETLRPLPAGLQIAVKLRSRISGNIAVGTLIDGVVAKNARLKDAGVIPAGSLVRGRIRRMESYTDPFPYSIVGLEFTELEIQGIRHLFYADLVAIDPTPGVSLTLSTNDTISSTHTDTVFSDVITRQTKETISLYKLPGVATFFYKANKLELPQDFRTVWKTRPLRP
jgi:hypothetical protein